ncbi:MAG: hypothetical protein KHZ58_12355 [Hungatella hathewayi]|nr:hypothetical protein [Hungatella hathewayi]
MVKIKVSYERPEELKQLLDRLRPDVKTWKVSGNQEGRFKKAYIELVEPRTKQEGNKDFCPEVSESIPRFPRP